MGYDVHITRRSDWSDDGRAIELEEWLSVVRGDPDLHAEAAAEATAPDGSTIRVGSPGLAVWTAYSGHDPNGNRAWFDHRRGEIVVKNPDEEIVGKMVEIAALLDARVQGDDGEFYS